MDGSPNETAEDPEQCGRPTRKTEKWSQKSNIATLASLKSADMSENSDDESEAFFAGGSIQSGQQILGPPSKKKEDTAADIMRSVKLMGAETVEHNVASTSKAFLGKGYKLGQSEEETEVIRINSTPPPESIAGSEDEDVTVVMKVWEEGFTINDGPLRGYDDPENQAFLMYIRRGMIPPELSQEFGNAIIHLDMEDYHNKSYMTHGPKVKPFTGQGYVLGSPAPLVVQSTNEATEERTSQAVNAIQLNPDLPTTSVSIRLADGSRVTAEFNHTHTVADIRSFINTARPAYAEHSYALCTTAPSRRLEDGDTLVQAKILSTLITQKLE